MEEGRIQVRVNGKEEVIEASPGVLFDSTKPVFGSNRQRQTQRQPVPVKTTFGVDAKVKAVGAAGAIVGVGAYAVQSVKSAIPAANALFKGAVNGYRLRFGN